MRKILYATLTAWAVSLAAPAMAQSLVGDGIKSRLGDTGSGSAGAGQSGGLGSGGLGGALGGGSKSLGASILPVMGSNTVGNAAGVLQYCIEHKYLSAANAENVKDQLMERVGLGGTPEPEQKAGYEQGLTGLLMGSDGSSFNLDKIQDDLKSKACDYVLENAAAFP